MDRRHFIAASATAGLLPEMARLASNITAIPVAAAKSINPVNPGIDRDRAQHVLSQLNLDALVLSRAENIRYAAGELPVTSKLGLADAAFAVIPTDPAIPIALILHQFAYYYSLVDAGLVQGVKPILVGGAGTDVHFLFADPEAGQIREREALRRAGTLSAGALQADMANALKQALPAGTLQSGAIGCDAAESLQLVQSLEGASAQFAEAAIKHLRLIKTPFEIEAMRLASAINIEAAHLAAADVRGSSSIAAIRASFNGHAGRLGNRPEFMVVDGVVAENYDAPIADGTAFLIDCVSSRGGYHGDYGRTVFLGEPRRAIAAKARAIGSAWDALRGELAPGMTFSQIRERGSAILSAFDPYLQVPFNPHSVGLAHTEQPATGLDGLPLDIALEAGMIISVDCPLMEASDEGTVHLEDLMLITPDGATPLHPTDNQIIVV